MGSSHSAVLGALLLTATVAPPATQAEELPPSYWAHWLEEVDLLMTAGERAAFEQISADSARFDFRREFWKVRDPQPHTPQNEWRDRWNERARHARADFGRLSHPGAQLLMAFGAPPVQDLLACGNVRTRVLQWPRDGDAKPLGGIFVSDREGPWRSQSKREAMLLFHGRRCPMQATRLGYYHPELPEPDELTGLMDLPPPPEAWSDDFLAANREPGPPPAAERDALQVTMAGASADGARIRLDLDASGLSRRDRFVTLSLEAEVLSGETITPLRRRFFVEGATGSAHLTAQEWVGPPGEAILAVELAEEGGAVLYRDIRRLRIPAPGEAVSAEPREAATTSSAASLAARPRVRLRPLPDIVVGSSPVAIQVTGSGVDTIRVLLDDIEVARLDRPPYRTDVDFGIEPTTRRLAAVALDIRGQPVARTALQVNTSGPLRVAVALDDRERGRQHVRVAVEGPRPEEVRRVEIFADEQLIEALEGAPFTASLEPGAIYVRAVAHLADGRSAEGVALIGVPGDLEVLDVDVIDVFASVLDPSGGPVHGLVAEDFIVREDGIVQDLLQVEPVEAIPLDVALVMDTSVSMKEGIAAAKQSALRFLGTVLREEDEAAFFSFNHQPQLVVPLTRDMLHLRVGINGVDTWGGTALWDSLMLALYYLQDSTERRAIVVLTDGLDADSEARYGDLYNSAVRSGTAIFAISIVAAGEEAEPHLLEQLTRDTGGSLFRVKTLRRLDSVYERIRQQLHLQYRLSYQSTGRGRAFRRVEVELRRPELSVVTSQGYFP